MTPLRQRQGLAAVRHDGCVVVLNLPSVRRQQSPYVFRGTAFDIWNLVDGSRTEQQIIAELIEATGAAPDTVGRETHEFIAQLLELGLIEEVPD
jgi:hypothetical protein